ncbi:MAG TPA: DUF6281 family protein [Marmoricola sp.]|nr:DUF6281 family protein [Marmoricola sp.]
MRMMKLLLGAVASLLACGSLVACSSSPAGGGGVASASCAAAVRYDGHLYLGQRPLAHEPATTGRLVDAVLPGCDDTGGQTAAEPDEKVQVAELADVPITTAFLWQGSVYVRDGQELPAAARAWFRAAG